MIHMTKGNTSTIILTLTEKVSITEPYYLIEFINDQTREVQKCFISDISEYPDRYNKFNITEGEEPDNYDGEVLLGNAGEYAYTVYQKESNANLTTTGLTVLEKGICVLHTTEETTSTYTPTETNYSYNGE